MGDSKMLRVIEDYKQIKAAQLQLIHKLKTLKHKYVNAQIGHIGYSWKTKIYLFPTYEIWWSYSYEKNRYWNGFGLAKHQKNISSSIICEINPPKKGIDRRISGVFLKHKDSVYLAHRGKIGGGKINVGKKLFWRKYSGKRIIALDGTQKTTFALIGSLNSATLLGNIARFTKEIARIKQIEIPNFAANKSSKKDRYRKYGGPEGNDHKRLKEWIANHPEAIGLTNTRHKGKCEVKLISGDTIDILFELRNKRYAVVEIETFNPEPGVYQALKYKVQKCAELRRDIKSKTVEAILVAWYIPDSTKNLCNKYGIKYYEKKI